MNEEKPQFLKDPMAILSRRWKPALMLGTVVLVVGVALVVTLMEPVFEATAKVFVSSPRISKDFVPVVEAGGPFERINAMVGKILARPGLAELAEEHDLYPERRGEELFAGTVGRMRDAIAIELDTDFRPIARARETARVFQIRFAYPDRDQAAVVANALAARFVGENIRARTEQARITADFMKRERVRAESELAAQMRLIRALKEEARGELPSELNASLKRLERLQDERKSLSLQIAQTESNLVVLSQGSAGANVVRSPEERLELLRSEIDEAASRFTANHPRLIALRAQAVELEKTVAKINRQDSSRPSLLSGTRRTLRELQNQLVDAQREIKDLEQRVARTPQRGEQLAELESKEAVLRENYVEFERKAKDADLALRVELAQQGRRVVVLEHATPPLAPLRSPLLYLLSAVIVALGAGIGAAVVLENADPVLISDEHLKEHLEVPLLASIPTLA